MVGEIAIPGETRPRCDAKRDILYIFFIGAKVFVSGVKTGGTRKPRRFRNCCSDTWIKIRPSGLGRTRPAINRGGRYFFVARPQRNVRSGVVIERRFPSCPLMTPVFLPSSALDRFNRGQRFPPPANRLNFLQEFITKNSPRFDYTADPPLYLSSSFKTIVTPLPRNMFNIPCK